MAAFLITNVDQVGRVALMLSHALDHNFWGLF